MIITLEEAKMHLKVDSDEEDNYIQILIDASEEFIIDATGKIFDQKNKRAKVASLFLLASMYENRIDSTEKVSQRVRSMVLLLLTQLSFGGD